MRIRIIWLVTLFMVASVLGWALPKIDVYRYQEGLINWKLDTTGWATNKKVLLLVHGFPMFKEGNMRSTMIGLANYFSKERKVGNNILPAYDCIYAIEYPKNTAIYETGKALSVLIQEKTNGFAQNQKIDIFAHSMGGLVTRVAVEKNGLNIVADKVNHIMFMGTPQKGFSIDELDCFKKNLDFLLTELNDLSPDSLFIYMLNLDNNNPVTCNYYAVVGLRSWAPKRFLEGENIASSGFSKVFKSMQDKNFPVHDGLISSKSAGLNLSPYCKSFKMITLDLNHEYINNHQLVFDAIDKWMIDDGWFKKMSIPFFNNGNKPFDWGKVKVDIAATSLKFPPGIQMVGSLGMGGRIYPYNPISNPQTNFNAGDVEINIIFTLSAYTREIKNVSAGLEIIGPDKQMIHYGPVDVNFEGWWQTVWAAQACQFYERGEYQVIVKSEEDKIIAKKTFTVN